LIFDNPIATHTEIFESRCKFISAVYGAEEEISLNEYRFRYYVKQTGKSKIMLPHLPPTEEAADARPAASVQDTRAEIKTWK